MAARWLDHGVNTAGSATRELPQRHLWRPLNSRSMVRYRPRNACEGNCAAPASHLTTPKRARSRSTGALMAPAARRILKHNSFWYVKQCDWSQKRERVQHRVLTKMGDSLCLLCSGSSTFLQRGSPPPPPWRLLPECFFLYGLTPAGCFPKFICPARGRSSIG